MKTYNDTTEHKVHPAVVASTLASSNMSSNYWNQTSKHFLVFFEGPSATANYYSNNFISKKTLTTIKKSNNKAGISIADFQKKYLNNFKEEDLRNQFESELKQELVEGKINKIKYYRILNKLTQNQLANLLQTKQPNIARLEKKGYTADIPTLKKLAKIFGIDYKELLE